MTEETSTLTRLKERDKYTDSPRGAEAHHATIPSIRHQDSQVNAINAVRAGHTPSLALNSAVNSVRVSLLACKRASSRRQCARGLLVHTSLLFSRDSQARIRLKRSSCCFFWSQILIYSPIFDELSHIQEAYTASNLCIARPSKLS